MLFLNKKLNRLIITIGFLIWNFIMSFYTFEIFPGSKNYFAEERIKRITGQNLNVTDTYYYDEFGGFQGDGYTLSFYDLQKGNVIDTLILKKFPIENKQWKTSKWRETPMNKEELLFLDNHLETNLYNNKDSLKLKSIYSFIKKSSAEKGNYYTLSEIKNRGIEIGFLSNHNKKFLFLNSMW
jgi:hypothetical protein